VDKVDNIQKVDQYYSESDFLYRKKTKSIHCGIWEEDTKNFNEAYINTNRIVCESIGINKKDIVLDAGCGIGGTTFFIAEKYKAHTTGINISEKQLESANKYKDNSPAKEFVTFLNRDFTDTKFTNRTFSKIVAIESICHAIKKENFLKEAYRILKPGGKVAILDAYLIKTALNGNDKIIYQQFLEGFALNNLATKKEFERGMRKSGFKDVRFKSYAKEVRKSTERYYTQGKILYPIMYFLAKLHIVPQSAPKHVISAGNIKLLLKQDIVDYGIFTAEK